ncbi:DUF5069 domain-containing protein [Coraliomargarita parva]|uniref:DUF5069 domain-containing protein n=1 Tax=Coraliomargarita parva TaxID=3014050 RepID=UPI0022B2D649|nr:DUF5069 domain-containing protein [Coraliomargarita parva]
MENYSYQKRLKAIWEQAVQLYRDGNREPDSYFDADTLASMALIGLNTMDVYDYAEDYVCGGEPDFETFLMVCEARRDYFLTIQKGLHSNQKLDPATLPAKDAEVSGIVWLPRILPKARAKLRGELPPETMYGCGGDRNFFKTNNIHPAEFLRAVWAYEQDDARIIEWVGARRAAVTLETAS